MAHAARLPVTSLALAPLVDVELRGHVLDFSIWEATRERAQLLVDEEIPEHGWEASQLELDFFAIEGCEGVPRIHFDIGRGFDDSLALALLPQGGIPGRYRGIVELPRAPVRIRIDPCAGAGRFLCSELSVTRIRAGVDLPKVADDSRALPRVGAVVHLSRAELWPQMAQYLSSIPSLARLYVCLPKPDLASTEPQIRARYPRAILRGLTESESGAVASLDLVRLAERQGIDLVCFTHTRLSEHLQRTNSGRWDMTHKLLGSKAIVQDILGMFAADPALGIIGPAGHLVPAACLPKFGGESVRDCLVRLRWEPEDVEPDLIPGSMYWARTAAMLPLRRLSLRSGASEAATSASEEGLDRCLPAAARLRGFSLSETRVDDLATKSVLDFAEPSFIEAVLSGGCAHARHSQPTGAQGGGTLVPESGLTLIDASSGLWDAKDNDPQFAIEGLEAQAGRWVLVSMKLLSAYAAQPPVIHFDYGLGWTAAGAVALARPSTPDGSSETVCHLPSGLKRARLDPIAFPGRFELSEFAIWPLTTLEAIDRIWRTVVAEPKWSSSRNEAIDNPESRGAPYSLRGLLPEYHAVLSRLDTSYAKWIEHYEVPAAEYRHLAREEAEWPELPTFSLVIRPQPGEAAALIGLVESVIGQLYRGWELLIACDALLDPQRRDVVDDLCSKDSRLRRIDTGDRPFASAVNHVLGHASGSYFALLDEEAVLHPLALHFAAQAVVSHPGCRLVFTDEDRIGVDGARRDPLFKCELNYELLLAHDMVSRLAFYRTHLLREIGGMREGLEGSEDYDVALRVAERTGDGPVVHVPRVLYHRRDMAGATARSLPDVVASSRRVVEDHLQRIGTPGEVAPAPGAPLGMNRVRFALPDPAPSVAIVIPTRDRADLLENCVESILSLTTYRNHEVVIVDNGSREDATHELLARYRDRGLTVLRDDSEFNFSAINNRAIARLSAEFVCLMNNDIEVVTPGWLEEMVGMAARPGVGAVGARLWFPYRQLQHAGLVLGISGFAGYAHKFLPAGEPGYACRAILHQCFSAVTGACLLVRKAVFDEVGGLDEKLTVAFNDVDFCLRLREAGYRTVWTPYAEMIHDESSSRGPDTTPENVPRLRREMEIMRARWGRVLFEDPCYSPNLSLDSEDFSLAWPPRVDAYAIRARSRA